MAVRHAGSDSACVSRAEEQRPVDPRRPPIAGDRRARGDDVGLVERPPQGRTAMAGRAERHALGGVGRIGALVVVGRDEPVDVDQQRGIRGEPGPLARHDRPTPASRQSAASRSSASSPLTDSIGNVMTRATPRSR